MADRYTFKIDGTFFNPIYSEANIERERIDVKNRTFITGFLKFGGNNKGSEYDALKLFIVDGKKNIEIYENNILIFSGKILLDGNWNDYSKIVSLEIEASDYYTPYYDNLDTKIKTNNNDWVVSVKADILPVFEFSIEKPDDLGWVVFTPTGANSVFGRQVYNGVINPLDFNNPAVTIDLANGTTYVPWDEDNASMETLAEYFSLQHKPDENDYLLLYNTANGSGAYWILKTLLVYTLRQRFFTGGRSLENVLKDLYVGDISDEIDISELNINDLYVFPSGAILDDNTDKKELNINILNEFFEKLLHVYVSITKPISTIISKFRVIKNIDYSITDIDANTYKGKDWAKNHNSYTINNLAKPLKLDYQMQGNNDFFNQIVTFSKAHRKNQPLIIPISNIVTDVQGALENEDNFKSKFFIVKTTTDILSINILDLITNDVTNPISLLNGSPWVDTTLSTFTLEGEGEAYTNDYFFSLGDVLRLSVTSPISTPIGTLKIELKTIVDTVAHRFTRLENGELEEEYISNNNFNLRIVFTLLFLGVETTITNIKSEIIDRKILFNNGALTGSSVLNGALSLANLLEDNIAEMPYNEANFNNNTDVSVHQQLDKENQVIILPSSDQLADIQDFDKSMIVGVNKLVPIKYTRNMGGDFDEFNGYLK